MFLTPPPPHFGVRVGNSFSVIDVNGPLRQISYGISEPKKEGLIIGNLFTPPAPLLLFSPSSFRPEKLPKNVIASCASCAILFQSRLKVRPRVEVLLSFAWCQIRAPGLRFSAYPWCRNEYVYQEHTHTSGGWVGGSTLARHVATFDKMEMRF